MRHKRIAHYSAAGLEPLPRPIASEVHIALQYANSQVFGKLFPRGNFSPISPPSLPSASPEPKFREMFTQVPGIHTEEKSVSTLVGTSCEFTDKATMYEEPRTATAFPTETVDVASQVIERCEIGLQASCETVTASTPVTEKPKAALRPRRKDNLSCKIRAGFEERLRKFEAISAEREAKEKEERENAAKLAQELQKQQLKSRLQERHQAYLLEKQAREQQRKAAESNYKRIKDAVPLHERIIAQFQEKESREEDEFRQELETVRRRMRRIDAKEIEEHGEKYTAVKETKAEEKSKARKLKLKQISEENFASDYFQSPLLAAELEERRSEAAKRQLETARAREALAKQKTYGRIAMDIHRPRQFLATRKAPSTPKIARRTAISVSPMTPQVRRRVRTMRGTEEVGKATLSEASTVKDYNSERRIAMERSLFASEHSSPVFTYQRRDSEGETLPALHAIAGRLTKEAQRGESLLCRLDKSPALLVKACDNVSAMYLDSIKAKLRIVNSLFE